MSLHRFEGKVAIVTGSSNGIGREVARLFVEEGAKVIICGRSETSLKETRSFLTSIGGSSQNILEIAGDLSKGETAERIVNEAVKKFGKIDILVNNAAGTAPDNTKERGFAQGMDVYDYVMNLNLRNIIVLTRLAMPYLLKSQGEIVMISSITGLTTSFPAFPYYALSKAALNQLTRALAAEFGPQGVRTNCVNQTPASMKTASYPRIPQQTARIAKRLNHFSKIENVFSPGIITTTIMKKQGATDNEQEEMENMLCSSASKCPLKRPGTCREMAEVVAFLADRQRSSYILGHCLVADGGSHIQMPVLAAWNTSPTLSKL